MQRFVISGGEDTVVQVAKKKLPLNQHVSGLNPVAAQSQSPPPHRRIGCGGLSLALMIRLKHDFVRHLSDKVFAKEKPGRSGLVRWNLVTV